MATIVTKTNWVQVDGIRIQKGSRNLIPYADAVGLQPSQGGATWKIPVEGTTIDGDAVTDADELMAFFEAQGFKSGGTGPGTGVQSVTGDGVGGTTENVVLTYPEPGDIGAATAAQGALADTAVQPAAITDVVRSQQEESVGAVITNIVSMTQAQYDGLASPSASTYYVITD